jgi:hypothetical protein
MYYDSLHMLYTFSCLIYYHVPKYIATLFLIPCDLKNNNNWKKELGRNYEADDFPLNLNRLFY